MTSFLKIPMILDCGIEIYHSTGSSGQSQPGYAPIVWQLYKRQTINNQWTIENIPPSHQIFHERYADFIATKLDHHLIVGEIKSSASAAISQNTEQMVGLLAKDQKLMLFGQRRSCLTLFLKSKNIMEGRQRSSISTYTDCMTSSGIVQMPCKGFLTYVLFFQ